MGAKTLPKSQGPETTLPPRPPFWARMSIGAGNLLQVGGLVIGVAILYADGGITAGAGIRILLMLIGWFMIYICCHALAHWLVGRLVGIEFRGYGLRGTDHPENYPPGLRQLMSLLPTFTVLTRKESMLKAKPVAKALMFSAGESSTAICSTVAAWFAWNLGIPGGQILFWLVLIFNLFSTIVTAVVPRGDYAKAWRALHSS